MIKTWKKQVVVGSCCAGHFHSRISVIAGGCLLWGIMTAGISLCACLLGIKLHDVPEAREYNDDGRDKATWQ